MENYAIPVFTEHIVTYCNPLTLLLLGTYFEVASSRNNSRATRTSNTHGCTVWTGDTCACSNDSWSRHIGPTSRTVGRMPPDWRSIQSGRGRPLWFDPWAALSGGRWEPTAVVAWREEVLAISCTFQADFWERKSLDNSLFGASLLELNYEFFIYETNPPFIIKVQTKLSENKNCELWRSSVEKLVLTWIIAYWTKSYF